MLDPEIRCLCGKPVRFGGKTCERCLLRRRITSLRQAGLPPEEIEKARRAWLAFDGVCVEGCGLAEQCGRWCFDHDHARRKFRGILGENCNRALGMVWDNPEALRNLASYLER